MRPVSRTLALTVSVAVACVALQHPHAALAAGQPPWDPSRGILIAGATVVTMDDNHRVILDGRVLVRNGQIVAVWSGSKPPKGVTLADAHIIEAGPRDLLFPGFINLHSHPHFNVVHAWPSPTSHAIPAQGKAGTDPYANRYQWGGGGNPASARMRSGASWSTLPRSLATGSVSDSVARS